MGFFQNMFKKSRGQVQDEINRIKEQVKVYEQKGDFIQLCLSYFELGCYYDESGKKELAMMYLGRASALSNSMEQVFCAVPDEIKDECSERIGELEEEEMLVNDVFEKIEEKAENLTENQQKLWCVLSLARFQVLFTNLSWLTDAEFLADIDEVVDIMFESLYGELEKEEQDFMLGFENMLYEFTDSGHFADVKNYIPASKKEPFQLFDLNGMNTMTKLYLLLDSFPNVLPQEEGFEEEINIDFIPCTLLVDYYLRNRGEQIESIEEVLEIQEEKKRICSDYQFVKTYPSREEALERLQEYKQLDLLG